ncbi:CGNR zinc finger domain-containing protein [Pseudonocardia sp. CA-107938]|uniref:CGNR zinc finger domain-containing protein n=1 Tax=Pseudonocardia sp. CA-107938 TaxID=3240021 RepID=UPI003D8A9626
MTRLASAVEHLVNLATATQRSGRPVTPRTGTALVDELGELLSAPTVAALRAQPGSGEGLADLAREIRAVVVAPGAQEKAALINAMIERYRALPYLVEDVGQPFHLHFHGSGDTVVDALGGEFAAMLALVVDGYGADRFGGCRAAGCDAVYIDLTRNGSRRHCSAACTARAKTAAYRDRKRQHTASARTDDHPPG